MAEIQQVYMRVIEAGADEAPAEIDGVARVCRELPILTDPGEFPVFHCKAVCPAAACIDDAVVIRCPHNRSSAPALFVHYRAMERAVSSIRKTKKFR